MDKKTNEVNNCNITRLKSNDCNFNWTITNYTFWANQKFNSPSFGFDNLGLRFHIQFSYADKTLKLDLHRDTALPAKLNEKLIVLTFSLLNENSAVVLTKYTKQRLRSYESYIGSIDMGTYKELNELKLELPSLKMMRILCNISIYLGTIEHVDFSDEKVKPESFSSEKLSTGLKSFVQSQTYSDVTLISNGVKFPAHKIILSAQSPVFNAMFQSNMVESKKNEVMIEDIKPEVLKEMLHYLYTGKVEQMNEIENDLLYAANKYDIVGLKLMCFEALIRSMSTENVVDILVLADQHDLSSLKTRAHKFITENAKKLIEMDKFNEAIISLTPSLRKDILRAIA